MPKLTKFDDEAHAKYKEGVDLMKQSVGATLGPRASNVMYGRPFGAPGVVHDGVTVAKEIDPEDAFLKVVAEHIKSASKATNDEAGDGTTTAVILVHSIYTEGRKLVTAGFNAQMLKKGVDSAVESVADWLKTTAVPIETNEQQLQIANISSQNERVGTEVAKAFKKLGNDAVIAVEESKQNHIYSEYKDGMEIDQGYLSRYFLTNPEFDEAAVEKANILITDHPLSTAQDMQKLFESLEELEVGNNLVIISPEIKDIALLTLVQNRSRGLSTLAVRAPSFGDEQTERLEDIAVSVGGTLISKGNGMTFEDLLPTTKSTEEGIVEVAPKARLGHAQKVVASKDTTTIVNGAGIAEDIAARVQELKKRTKRENISDFEVERLQERIAKLTSGIAIINVGARTEGEAKELKERTIDAVEAIKAANKGGIVAGGETPLLRASWELQKRIPELKEGEEFVAGYRLVIKAMQAPFKTLMENSGLDAGQMLERLTVASSDKDLSVGIDVVDGTIKDLISAGVIDPVLVPVSALLNATSSAMSMLTSNVIIVDKNSDKDNDVV